MDEIEEKEDISKVKKITGWKPITSFDKGLKKIKEMECD